MKSISLLNSTEDESDRVKERKREEERERQRKNSERKYCYLSSISDDNRKKWLLIWKPFALHAAHSNHNQMQYFVFMTSSPWNNRCMTETSVDKRVNDIPQTQYWSGLASTVKTLSNSSHPNQFVEPETFPSMILSSCIFLTVPVICFTLINIHFRKRFHTNWIINVHDGRESGDAPNHR